MCVVLCTVDDCRVYACTAGHDLYSILGLVWDYIFSKKIIFQEKIN